MKSIKIGSILSIALIFTILVAILPAIKMARPQQDYTIIFQDDFEGSDSEWTNTFTQGTGTSVDLNATHMPYAGSEHGEYNFSSGVNVAAYSYIDFGDYYPNLTFSAWYSMNNTNSWRELVEIRGDGCCLATLLYSYGVWRFWFSNTTGQQLDFDYPIDANTYQNITIESFIHPTDGYHRVYINETQIFNLENLENTRWGDITGVRVGTPFMEDAYESISVRVDDVVVTAGPPNHEVTLDAGWNLVSFPIIPSDPSFSSIFSGVGYYEVLTWNETSYVRPSTAEAGWSYWIFVLSATTVNVTGTPVESYERDLPTGWSLIGSIFNSTPPTPPVDAETAFPDYYELYTWTGTGYVSSTTIEGRAYKRLGKGYWTFVMEPTHITVQR